MNKVILGVVISLSALMLIYMNYAVIGIPLFVGGIVLMNKGGREKR